MFDRLGFVVSGFEMGVWDLRLGFWFGIWGGLGFGMRAQSPEWRKERTVARTVVPGKVGGISSNLSIVISLIRINHNFGERGRTVVDFVLRSERERDPDELQQLGPLLFVQHLVQPHIRCVGFGVWASASFPPRRIFCFG
jgi:hypothetical protein